MTNGAPGAGAQHGPRAGLGDGGVREGRLNRRNAIWAALIGAVAVIAATVLGVYLSSQSHPSSVGPQVGISSIQYPVVKGVRVIEVQGTVQDLGGGEHVYAFAGQHAGLPPWYPGGPAAISGGLWTAYITGLPASGGNFSVWAGMASPPPACLNCVGGGTSGQLQELTNNGPHSPLLRRVSQPRHAVLPTS